VETAAVIGLAMTDYLLAAGTNRAPATHAPEHMAAWLESRDYRLVRLPGDRDDADLVSRIAAAIDWRSVADDASGRQAIIRQVLTAVGIPGGTGTGSPRVA
jgi:hypothetical protein